MCPQYDGLDSSKSKGLLRAETFSMSNCAFKIPESVVCSFLGKDSLEFLRPGAGK